MPRVWRRTRIAQRGGTPRFPTQPQFRRAPRDAARELNALRLLRGLLDLRGGLVDLEPLLLARDGGRRPVERGGELRELGLDGAQALVDARVAAHLLQLGVDPVDRVLDALEALGHRAQAAG